MKKQEIAKSVFEKAGTVAATADFIAAGLTNYDLSRLCGQGRIERIRNGYYVLAGSEDPKEELLLSLFLPQGIICVESALFFYGYSDFVPREWTVSVPRSSSRAVTAMRKNVPVKAYYVPDPLLCLGKTEGSFNGVSLAVYDRERTICDCFRHRTGLDHEIFNKAVNAYAADPRKNTAKLSEYAKKMGIYLKMTDVMEVLLNG